MLLDKRSTLGEGQKWTLVVQHNLEKIILHHLPEAVLLDELDHYIPEVLL